MEDNKIIKLVYTFFLGLLLAVFVGVGIDTFYPPPEEPKYQEDYSIQRARQEPTKEELKKQQEYDKKWEKHQEELKPYNRNVSIVTLLAAFILIAISIIYDKKLKFLSDGVMLGGLFTLFYSIGRGFASSSSSYVFIIVSAGLALVLYLGYRRFVKPQPPKKSKITK